MENLDLGSGYSGTVRAAKCRHSGKEVAVKTYRKDQLGDKELAHMRSEIAVHESLSHPGIVSVDAVFETKESVTLVLERLHGGELFERVATVGELAEWQAAEIAVQLLQALVYLHDRHITHRDVKLENVMFESHGGNSVKLIDFGFAKRRNPENKLTQQCGTTQYMAPELLEGLPYDESVDIWSTGVVMYGMLTGRVLVVNGEAKFGSHFQHLSAEAQDFVHALVQVDPEERMSAREALKHPWLAKHVSAQRRQAPAKPETRHSFLWQAGSEAMHNMLKLGAMGLHATDRMSASAPKPTKSTKLLKPTKAKVAAVLPYVPVEYHSSQVGHI